MINVCTVCHRLNPLDLEKCHYCQGACEKIGNNRLITFLIEFNQRQEEKETVKKEETDDRAAK